MISFLFRFNFLLLLLYGCANENRDRQINTSNNSKSQLQEILSSDSEKESTSERIEKKYGSQWDFCDCVRKNDSIDKLLKSEKLNDSELDKLLIRADYVDKKCKLFLTDLQSKKPSDRANHLLKVKACLENQ